MKNDRRNEAPPVTPKGGVKQAMTFFTPPLGGTGGAILGGAAFLLLFSFCQKNEGGGPGKVPHTTEPTLTAERPLLKLLDPAATGIGFQNSMRETYEDNIATNLNKYNGGGVGIGDFNRDGLEDIYFVSCDGRNGLFLNKGGLKFEDITDAAGVAGTGGFETAVTVADVNADGWPDLYVCRSGPVVNDERRNKLFINNGGGSPPLGGQGGAGTWSATFSERAREYGLDDKSASTGANFFDFDLDGDLDLYLLNHPVEGIYGTKIETKPGPGGKLVPLLDPKIEWDTDRFYRNDGPPSTQNGKRTGGFTDISKEVGVWNFGFGLSVGVTDFNRDGWPDVYVGNDVIQPDQLFINEKGRHFTDRLGDYMRHITQHTMGTDLTDFDNDGLVDLLAVDMLGATNYRRKTFLSTLTQTQHTTLTKSGYFEPVVRNVLQRNNGNGTFSDVGCLAGVFKTDWSWSGLLFDIDNDGLRDLHVTNGYRRDINDRDFMQFTFAELRAKGTNPRDVYANFDDFLALLPTYKPRNFLFQNKNDWKFEDMGGQWATMPAGWSLGSAWADLDNDGDLDLVTNNLEQPAFVYQNLAADEKRGNFLQIKLAGSPANPMAVGASALAEFGGKTIYAEMNPTRGIFSSVEHLFHFGLGGAQVLDKLTVRWPDGKTQFLTQVPVNQRLTLKWADASGHVVHLSPAAPAPVFFVEKTTASGVDFRHEENAFNDFEAWRLNPWKLSELGPAIAAGDANGDGLEDFFIGNSFDRAGALFSQQADGRFKRSNQPVFEQDKIYEDGGAAFFDADGDRDLDLFVVSGGAEATSPLAWVNRLYLNDGKGVFAKASPGSLPATKEVGLAAEAHDMDGDGDPDLVLGGRTSPGRWPETPKSYIFKNDGKGRFTDATAELAPAFSKIGMVTDILFADLDGEAGDEMAVCGEWMPVCIFKKTGGAWADITQKLGLENTHGLWNRLAAADLDGDGDPDLVGGNIGLNTRYRASAEGPLRVFGKDFDGNGQVDPIMAFWEDGKTYPFAQKDLLVSQMPILKKKFLYAKDYSNATVEQVFAKKDLDAAPDLRAELLETCWFENQKGTFKRRELPNQAQAAPVLGIAVADFTGDGLADILLAGNKLGMEVETNRCDAGNGALLAGDGRGGFVWVDNLRSGFWASDEVRDLRLLKGAGGRRQVVVANNSGRAQVFGVLK